MSRGLMWTGAFVLVAMFVVAGAVFDDQGQRTWALVSTIAIVGVAVLVGIYLAIGGLQRLGNRVQRLLPRAFRRR
jgi:hypothetical protein